MGLVPSPSPILRVDGKGSNGQIVPLDYGCRRSPAECDPRRMHRNDVVDHFGLRRGIHQPGGRRGLYAEHLTKARLGDPSGSVVILGK